jgi:hypothetical protein
MLGPRAVHRRQDGMHAAVAQLLNRRHCSQPNPTTSSKQARCRGRHLNNADQGRFELAEVPDALACITLLQGCIQLLQLNEHACCHLQQSR